MPDQLPLFGFKEMKPRTKLPITREQILEAQALFDKGDQKGAEERLRDIRYKLEAYCNRINV